MSLSQPGNASFNCSTRTRLSGLMALGASVALASTAAGQVGVLRGEDGDSVVARGAVFQEFVGRGAAPGAGPLAVAPGAAARSTREVMRSLLVARLLDPNACYRSDLTQAELDQLIASTRLRPAGEIGRNLRYGQTATVWTGDGLQGPSVLARRARITYSFPPDGVEWSSGSPRPNGPNTLGAALESTFGVRDLGREYIRQSIAAYRRVGGLEYQEVRDNGVAFDFVTSRRSDVGDVRIGGYALTGADAGPILAVNFYPASGGDMCIDTDEFAGLLGDPDNSFRALRNVIAHEHGHGLGFSHQIPCNQSKLMEPFLSTLIDMIQVDERRGLGANYGDRYAGNHTPATARDLGPLCLCTPVRAVLERDLSLNGAGGAGGSNQDWFRFTLPISTFIVVAVTPTGGTYSYGEQSSDLSCAGLVTSRDASVAGNPDVEIRDATGVAVLASGTLQPGVAESVFTFLPAGAYTIRVNDAGPNTGQLVQLYDLRVGIPGFDVGPYANAGINKRIGVNEVCQFMGDINSLAGENPIVTYEWDTDGNGSLETVGARPQIIYGQPGVRSVRLRVTDSAGSFAEDTITVTVFGIPPSVSSVSPASSLANNTVPIVINGSSLQSASVSISGTGATLVGTPVVNAGGSQITGLSVAIAAGAIAGERTLTITTPSGTATRPFSVTPAPSNDTCAGAVPMTLGSLLIGNTNLAVADGQSTCDGTMPRDLFYSFLPNASGTYRFETNTNPAFDTILSVHSGCPATTANELACNDDVAPGQLGSRVDAFVTATVPVIVRVTGFAGATGVYRLSSSVLPPANAVCSGTLPVLPVGETVGSYEGSLGTPQPPCSSSTISPAPAVFYQFSPACSGRYRFESRSLGATVLSLHTGCPTTGANILACDDQVGFITARARFDVTLTGGVNYVLRIGAATNLGNDFSINVSYLDFPTNDTCDGVAGVLPNLAVGTTAFDSCTADDTPPTEPACPINARAFGGDLWYAFTPPSTGRTTLCTCGSTFDTLLAVYDACPTAGGQSLACDDDLGGCGVGSAVTFTAQGGTTYRVRVGGFNGARGAGVITRLCPADFNASGTRDVADIFAFLSAWFAGAPGADFNGSGVRDVADIFSFLSAWFAGCS